MVGFRSRLKLGDDDGCLYKNMNEGQQKKEIRPMELDNAPRPSALRWGLDCQEFRVGVSWLVSSLKRLR